MERGGNEWGEGGMSGERGNEWREGGMSGERGE